MLPRLALPIVLTLVACAAPAEVAIDVDGETRATVEAVLAAEPAAAFEARAERDPAAGVETLRAFAAVLAGAPARDDRADGDLDVRVERYVDHAVAARVARVGPDAGAWPADRLWATVALIALDPGRFGTDDGFRSARLAAASRSALGDTAPEVRRGLLDALTEVGDANDDRLESEVDWTALAARWDLLPRAAAGRRDPSPPAAGAVGDLEAPTRLSVLSLPSFAFDPADVVPVIEALRRELPGRDWAVLADGAVADAVRAVGGARFHVLESYPADLSPWPRDPILPVRRDDGGVLWLARPDVQPGREGDRAMAPRLAAALPDDLDADLGRPTWAESDVPFHNGHVLLVDGGAWAAAHAVEPAVLRALGVERLRSSALATAEGWAAYVRAVDAALADLARVVGRPVTPVHPLPPPDAPPDASFLAALAGGAGFDLDALVTVVPGPEGRRVALVADPDLGVAILRGVADPEANRLSDTLGLGPRGSSLVDRVAGFHASDRGRGLRAFLAMVRDHLAAAGLDVRPLPLAIVPADAVPDAPDDEPFLVTGNNVVLERDGDGIAAFGFASTLPALDARWTGTFAAAGVELHLLPPLAASVRRNGGFRCASQHVR